MKANILATTATATAMMILNPAVTRAQGEGGEFQQTPFDFVGRSPGMGPKCPPVSYHVITKSKTQLEGAAFSYEEGNMVMYLVTGSLASDNRITMKLKPMGAGTPSELEGTYKNGMLMLKTANGACHVDEFMMMPVVLPGPGPQQGGGG